MKLADIRGKDSAELKTDMKELQKEAFQINFRASAESLTDHGRRRQIRRAIARIQTVLRERQIKQETKQS